MLGSIRMAKKMNKEEFLSKRYAIDLKIKKLNGEKEQLEKEYIESNQVFPIGSKVCITVMAHERILVPEAKKLAYIADYDIDDNGEVVPSLRQLDCNGGMSAIPLFVNLIIKREFPCLKAGDDSAFVHTFFWLSMYFLTISSDICPTDSTK